MLYQNLNHIFIITNHMILPNLNQTSRSTMKQGFEYKCFCQLHFILLLNPDDSLVRSADIVLAHRRFLFFANRLLMLTSYTRLSTY